MRFATGLSSLGYNYIARSFLQPTIFSRASSLSAIHRGLRRSEKVNPRGSRPAQVAPTFENGTTKRMTGAEKRHNIREVRREARQPPERKFIARRGKTGPSKAPSALSKKARFFDPTSPHGKKSLVYELRNTERLQHGDFTKQLQGARDQDQGRPSRERSGGRSAKPGNPDRYAPRIATRLSFPRLEPAYLERPPGRSSGTRSLMKTDNQDKQRGLGNDSFIESVPERPAYSSQRSKDFAHGQDPYEQSFHNKDGEWPSYEDNPRPYDDRLKPYETSFERQTPESKSFDRQRYDRADSRYDDRQRPDRTYSDRPKRVERENDKRTPERTYSEGPRRVGWQDDDRIPEKIFSNKPSRFERQDDDQKPHRTFSDRSENFDRRNDDRRPGRTLNNDKRTFDGPKLDENGEGVERKPRRSYTPISIPYTTAASQFLYGTTAVEAAMRLNRRKLYKLYIYHGTNRRNHDKDRQLCELAEEVGCWVDFVEDQDGLALLDKMSGSRPHNGYVLEVSPLPQLPVKALGRMSEDEDKPGFQIALGHQTVEDARVNGTSDFVRTKASAYNPLVLVLDQVLDPGNLGAILRTASFMGVTAVAVSKRGSASMTPVALKAAAGAAESMVLFSVDSPVSFLEESRKAGWKIYAAVPPKGQPGRRQIDTGTVEKEDPLYEDPCILLVGSEGEGLSKGLIAKANFEVNIPNFSGSDLVDSLNVSVATALLCSAFLKGNHKTRALKAVNKTDTLF